MIFDERNDEIRYLGDVQRLVLKPGDWVVLRYDRVLSQDARSHLVDQMKAAFPDNRVLVLDGALRVGVLSPNQ